MKSAETRERVRSEIGGMGDRPPRLLVCVATLAVAVLTVVGASTLPAFGAAQAQGSGSSSAPGVTSNQITVGAIGTLSGSLASDFAGLVPGVKAYFDMVNAQGGINGRKLNLAYNLDDGGSSSQFSSLARTLVDQDHVFAVVGVSSYWFTPTFFRDTGIPTYGYNVSNNWLGAPNLFAANGSYICYSCGVPGYVYLLHKVHASSVAVLSYSVSTSLDACQAAISGLQKAGIKVSYQDLNLPIDGNPAPDIQRIERAGSDFIFMCTDVDENISVARAVQQYGLKVKQLWLNGSDQSVINKYSNLLQNTYFYLQAVPLSAPTQYYPGLAAYLSAMKKYEPGSVGDALAVQGWQDAALFAEGVKAAGNDLTWQRVVQLTNQMTNTTEGGMSTVTDWTVSHNGPQNPGCAAVVKPVGTKLTTQFTSGHQVFLCFNNTAIKNPTPVTPPAGTPGT